MAGRIPEPFIDELLGRIDIVDVVDSRVPLKAAGRGEFKACCPFHEEKTPSFTVSSGKQFYHCFGCGAHGSAIGFLMQFAHLDFVESIEELAALAGVDVQYEHTGTGTTQIGKSNQSEGLLELLEQANDHFKQQLRQSTPAAKQAVEYLKNRGLSGSTARDFDIGLAVDAWDGLIKVLGKDDSTLEKLKQAGLVTARDGGGYYDKFRDRIIFPIHDFKGRVVAFGGRVMGQGEPKYLNSPETPVFHKGNELYGLYRAKSEINQSGFVLVVEGYMDVIALAQFEIKNAVATLGTATTTAHLNRLFRYTDQVIFCFDGDKAGQRAAQRALENVLPVLGEAKQVKFLFLPQGQDPDSLVQEQGKSGFEQQIDKAVPLSTFLLTHLQQQTDLSHIEGRAKLLVLAKPYLQSLSNGPLKQLLIERLAGHAQTDAMTVMKQLVSPNSGGAGRYKQATKDKSTTQSPWSQSLVAKAISLLIQHPNLNQQQATNIKTLEGLKFKGLSLFMQLSEQLTNNPKLNTGMLIERYRDTPYSKALEILSTRHHLVENDEQLEKIFADILNLLQLELVDQKINQIMVAASSRPLTPEEDEILTSLHRQHRKIKDN